MIAPSPPPAESAFGINDLEEILRGPSGPAEAARLMALAERRLAALAAARGAGLDPAAYALADQLGQAFAEAARLLAIFVPAAARPGLAAHPLSPPPSLPPSTKETSHGQ